MTVFVGPSIWRNIDCRTALNCDTSDLECKTNAVLVKKVAAWILAGAPNN